MGLKYFRHRVWIRIRLTKYFSQIQNSILIIRSFNYSSNIYIPLSSHKKEVTSANKNEILNNPTYLLSGLESKLTEGKGMRKLQSKQDYCRPVTLLNSNFGFSFFLSKILDVIIVNY